MRRCSGYGCFGGSRALTFGIVLLGFSLPIAFLEAEHEARVTVLVHDVNLLPEADQPRPAILDETVKDDTAVRTGDDSRSELTFDDLTITRLGSNTIFSFNKAGRSVQLNAGAILLRVPKNSGGARMKTDACSVAITGTTVILEAQDGRNTLTVLEGGARMWLNKSPRDVSIVRRGQLIDVPPNARKMPRPVNIDINSLMRSHPLITNFPPLPSENEILSGSSASSSSYGGTSQNPVVYNPPPPRPKNPTGPVRYPGGNYPPAGNPYPQGGGNNGGPKGPGGVGKPPKGGSAPNAPATPTPTPGKGHKKPGLPNNGINPNGPIVKNPNPTPTPAPILKGGNKIGPGHIVNKPNPSPTPKHIRIKPKPTPTPPVIP